MNQKTKQCITEKVDRIVEEYRFSNRSSHHPAECPCYTSGKPCHDVPGSDLNCFFCVCPNYDNSTDEGGCLMNNPAGKFYYNANLPLGRIWDCSDCGWPHEEANVRKKLEELFGLKSERKPKIL